MLYVVVVLLIALSGSRLRRRQSVPIVFITAHEDEAQRRRMLEPGAVEYLFKPFSDTALLGAIQAALRAD
ncbi:response regulator [Cupriavidus lacunae]|uniref:response regulator n=1 Tax=Cupriavidus TaxID=106589 RepID=UPI001FCA46C1|nr:response regulator [Cupriavidus lacunae]